MEAQMLTKIVSLLKAGITNDLKWVTGLNKANWLHGVPWKTSNKLPLCIYPRAMKFGKNVLHEVLQQP